MKKILLGTISLVFALPMMAQDAYDAANIATKDLNGTARYVGMGGALDALGADISTIGTNPAGVGLFRHSEIRASLSVVSQQDSKKFGLVKELAGGVANEMDRMKSAKGKTELRIVEVDLLETVK